MVYRTWGYIMLDMALICMVYRTWGYILPYMALICVVYRTWGYIYNALYVINMCGFQGHGRKRLRTRCTNRFDPDLLTWMPTKPEIERAGPKKSMYKVDYRGTPAQPQTVEMIIRRPKTSFDDDRITTTSYRYAYGLDHPNRELLSAMSNQGLTSCSSTNLADANRKQKKARSRETVGSCLNWQAGRTRGARPVIPAATQLVPAPPPPQTELGAMDTTAQLHNGVDSVPVTNTAPAALETSIPVGEMAGL